MNEVAVNDALRVADAKGGTELYFTFIIQQYRTGGTAGVLHQLLQRLACQQFKVQFTGEQLIEFAHGAFTAKRGIKGLNQAVEGPGTIAKVVVGINGNQTVPGATPARITVQHELVKIVFDLLHAPCQHPQAKTDHPSGNADIGGAHGDTRENAGTEETGRQNMLAGQAHGPREERKHQPRGSAEACHPDGQIVKYLACQSKHAFGRRRA